MSVFMNDSIFLKNNISFKLYDEIAKSLPIVDYHCHLKAKDIYEDKKFENISQIWLANDHYKWRLMRANGVQEKYITGDASDKEKFRFWAKTIERAVGNPLYHWSHMELKRYFNITEPLNIKNYEQIWEKCNYLIKKKGMSPKYFISEASVLVVGTTDAPSSDLEYHKKLAMQNNSFKVIPTMRADTLVEISNQNLSEFEESCQSSIYDFDSYLKQIFNIIEHFNENGCRSIDLGIERIPVCCYKSDYKKTFQKIRREEAVSMEELANLQIELITRIADYIADLDWVFQFHIGAKGSVNKQAKEKIGLGTGFDSIVEQADILKALINLLNEMNRQNNIPRIIFYNIDGTENVKIETIIACFQENNKKIKSKIQHGPAWWFQDTLSGNEKQIRDLSEQGILMNFIGMTTDSRSYLSYVRHDYFRRILCSYIGEMIENGEIPDDFNYIKNIIESISYGNALEYFHI